MAHLHLTALPEHSERLIAMGEEPWRVRVTGALGLDNLSQIELLSLDGLNSRFGLALESGDAPNVPPISEVVDRLGALLRAGSTD